MARFEAYIFDEGLAAIDGEDLVPAPGQSIREAVLDWLQRYAVEGSRVVEATVNDGPGDGHFVLAVSPDGSSRLVDSEETSALASGQGVEAEGDPGSEPQSTVEPQLDSAPHGGPRYELEPEPAPKPPPAAAPVTAVATAVARATAAARGPATHAPAAPVRAAVDLPAELAGQISHINALARADRLDEAYDLASRLRERLTEEAGTEDPYAVEARAVEAYIAHLSGDHREAVVLALAVARIRCRRRDPRAPEDVARAAAAWQWLDEDRAVAAHGHELLLMWDRLELRGPLPSAHAELARQVSRRLEELEILV